MKTSIMRSIAVLLILALASACRGPEIYISPRDGDQIESAASMIVRTTDGVDHELRSAEFKQDHVVGVLADGKKADIEFASVQSVRLKQHIKGVELALLSALDLIVLGWLAHGAATAPSPPPTGAGSCPLIYSFDGQAFVLEAEPYGGAVVKGLQRSEWIGLDRLRETGGFYKIRSANELSETEYVDELKLVVVDHAPGARALPDANGRIHIISNPIPPSRAIAKGGLDVRAALVQNDRAFWEPAYPTASAVPLVSPRSAGPAPSPEDIAEATPVDALRGELILEFPKPAGAKSAKLVANAWTTFWGSNVAKSIIALHGRELPAWTDEVNARGPEYRRIMGWFLAEELYMLKVEVETEAGWKPRTVIFGGGPIVARDKAYLMDVSDAAGDTLRLRMRPPAGFWRFDSFAVDYGDAAPLSMTEIAPTQAHDAAGRDVRASHMASDGDYFVMPHTGDYAEILFAAPPATPGAERSIVLKASGYYDPHLIAEGEPRNDLLKKIHTEPGATLRFAYAEYLKMLASAAPSSPALR